MQVLSFVLTGFLGDISVFDPANNIWTNIDGGANVPSARAGHGFASVNDNIYVSGGRGPSGTDSVKQLALLKILLTVDCLPCF